jgi:hypothetical protein
VTNETTEFRKLLKTWLSAIPYVAAKCGDGITAIWPARQPKYPCATYALRTRTPTEIGGPSWDLKVEIALHGPDVDILDEIMDVIVKNLNDNSDTICTTLTSALVMTQEFVPVECDEEPQDAYVAEGNLIFVQTLRVSARITKPQAGW